MATNILNWASEDGQYRRQVSSFRSFIKKGSKEFPPASNRYHLYVSLACPWAHRTLIMRKLKGLEKVISVSVVHYLMTDKGWHFDSYLPDHIHGLDYIRDLYNFTPGFKGRYTVPVLYDKLTNQIVNNESSEIIRMLNTEFSEFCDKSAPYASIDLYPATLQPKIDELNSWVYDSINNGVYKSGFATKQSAYEEHVVKVFESLDRVETILSKQEWLVGGQLTEADIRLFTTIVRFDPVYHGHFKCNVKSIGHDYPAILKWARKIYQIEGVADTVDMEHIKKHYYMSHTQINPTQVVPVGNGPDLSVKI